MTEAEIGKIAIEVLQALPVGKLKDLFHDIANGYREDAIFKARIITETLAIEAAAESPYLEKKP